MWMTRVAVANPVFATMVMAALTVLGLFSYNKLRVEQLPDVTLPYVSVEIRYPGASPEAVETDITKPVEQAMNTLPGVDRIISNSGEGWSNVFVQFKLSVDGDKAAQDVREKVSQVRPSLPKDAQEPVVRRVGSEDNQQPVVYMVLLSDKRSARELTFIAEKTVQTAFERINGVGNIALSGTTRRQVEIRLKPQALAQAGVGTEQVLAAVRAANVNAPVGQVSGRAGDAVVRVDGRIKDPREFADIVVATRSADRGPVQVRLGQVADVVDAEQERTQIARFNGAPGIGISVFKIQDANLVEVGKSVLKAADELRKTLPADVQLKTWYASSDWVQQSLDNVRSTIFEGALLTIVIVFLFLASWRSTVITGLTLPIAVISTFVALYAFGFSLNYLTLMALSLCIGLLIDDAIVVRENISRHLQLGKSPRQAALDGTNEIGLAVLATTFSIVAVFVPIAFMCGVIGKFFYAFGITVAVAVMISLFVSFTLDPMLSAYWRDPPHGAMNLRFVGPVLRRFDALMTAMEHWYSRIIEWALNRRKTTVAIAVAALVASFVLLPFLGSEFIPETDQGFTNLRITMPPGSTLQYADEKAQRVEEVLREFKEVELAGSEIDAKNININLKLIDHKERRRSQKEVEQAIRERVATIPGVDLKIGWNSPIWINVLGNNDVALAQVLTELRSRVSKVPGIVDLDTSVKPGTPALSIRLKPQAADLGITHAQLGAVLRTYVTGEESGTWLSPEGENYTVLTRLPKDLRTNVEDLRNLNVAAGRMTPDGQPMVVPLEQVATIERSTSPDIIKRQDLQRRVALYAGVKDRTVGEVSADVQKIVDDMKKSLPSGVRFDVSGAQKDLQESFGAAMAALGLAVIFLYFILASQFGSFLQPLAIMVSLPMALIGVVLALLLTHTTLNIFSMIGIIMLMGLVTKNAILLVDFANRAQRDEGLPQHEALLRAGRVRLRPILMTTGAMVLGMLPLALGLGEGSEQQSPMGRAIIGGVITSTLLTLVLVPVLYSWLDRRGRRAQRDRDAVDRAAGGAVLSGAPADRA
jgi:hydrophobe/amphiphile efflux-1 (HAE1) family protein